MDEQTSDTRHAASRDACPDERRTLPRSTARGSPRSRSATTKDELERRETGLSRRGPRRRVLRQRRAPERLARRLQEHRHRLHRPVGLRQVDVHPLLQPDERPDHRRGCVAAPCSTTATISTRGASTRSRRCGGGSAWCSSGRMPFPMSIFDNIAYAMREQSSRRPRGGGGARRPRRGRCCGRRASGTR